MNTKKLRKNLIIITIISIMLICCAMCMVNIGNVENVLAESIILPSNNLEEICATYTSDKSKDDIFNTYKNYVTSRYNLESSEKLIYDEEILKLIPEELFIAKERDFLYIGTYYGFYFNYDINEQTIFIYFIETNFERKVSGQFVQKITPYYYNKYKYDSYMGAVSVDYHVTEGFYYYHKYYDEKKVAIQNVAFQGKMLNTNELNPYELEYRASEDRGAYFIGGNFIFNGVANFDIGEEIYAAIKFFLGFDKRFETAINVVETIELIDTLTERLEYGYRDHLQNDQNYGFNLGETEHAAQIEKYEKLLKDYLSYIAEYPGKVTPRFLPQYDGYVENTYYYNYLDQSNKANCNIATKIKLDIIEEGGGTNFTYIARDKESNQYEQEIYNENKLELKDNETKYTRTLPQRRQPLAFTAPESGIYTIETVGGVRNRFEEYGTAAVTDKEDGINQLLTVDLAKGETLDFHTRNLTDKVGSYGVKVTYTPTEIALGEKVSFTLASGEAKYLSYIATGKEIIDYSVKGQGNYFTSQVSYGTLARYVNPPEITASFTSTIKATAAGRYIIGVRNESVAADNFEIVLSAPSAIAEGQASSLSVSKKRALAFTPQMSSRYDVGIDGAGEYTYTIYDAELSTLYTAAGNGAQSKAIDLEKGKKYYVVIERNTETPTQFTVRADIAPPSVSVGVGRVSKPFNEFVYLFEPTTSAQYIFSATGCLIDVYDETSLYAQTAGAYELTEGERYYIVLKGSTSNTISLNIGFVSTTSPIGTIPSVGYVFIRFTPDMTDEYDVEGTTQYEWYDATLTRKTNKILTQGSDYYVKISGSGVYDVDIVRHAEQISVSMAYNRTPAGLYTFDVKNAGDFIFKIYVNSGESIKYSIYGNNRELLYGDKIADGGEFFIGHLDSGKAYIDIKGDIEGLTINMISVDGESPLSRVIGSKTVSLNVLRGSDNMFYFTAEETKTHYLRFDYVRATNIQVVMADSDNNIIQATPVAVENFNNEFGHVYCAAYELTAGKKYKLNLFYSQDSSSVLNISIRISVPIYVTDVSVKEVGHNNRVTKIIDGGKAVNGVFLLMGVDYENEAVGLPKIKWRIKKGSDTSLAYKTTVGILSVRNNVDKNGSTNLTLEFADDSTEPTAVGLMVKIAYTAQCAYDYDNDIVYADIKDAYGEQITDNNVLYYFDIFYGTSQRITSFGIFCPFADRIFNMDGENSIRTTISLWLPNRVTITYKSDITLESETINLTKIVQGEFIIDKSFAVIDAKDATSSSNITFIVKGTCKYLTYYGSQSMLNNIRFDFESSTNCIFVVENLKSHAARSVANTDDFVIDAVSVNELKIINGGTSKIDGGCSDALIIGRNITFLGNGTFTVTADNGLSGENGARGAAPGMGGSNGMDGANGFNAVRCNSIINNNSSSLSISIRGGDGGNGGRGGDGAKGADGKAINNVSVNASGNGGRGGNGGNGGKPGYSVSGTAGTGITVIRAYDGKGGDGGHGGDGGKGVDSYGNNLAGTYYLMLPCKGGNGGHGGDAGKSSGSNIIGTKPRGGDGGNGGKGGDGNSRQVRSGNTDSFLNQLPCSGGRGGNGGSGDYGGNGGDGGDGGRGYNGSNAVMFGISGSDGSKGGNGGDGGSAGIGTISNGVGGAGGTGGAGGKAGSGIFKQYSDGPRGANGANG